MNINLYKKISAAAIVIMIFSSSGYYASKAQEYDKIISTVMFTNSDNQKIRDITDANPDGEVKAKITLEGNEGDECFAAITFYENDILTGIDVKNLEIPEGQILNAELSVSDLPDYLDESYAKVMIWSSHDEMNPISDFSVLKADDYKTIHVGGANLPEGIPLIDKEYIHMINYKIGAQPLPGYDPSHKPFSNSSVVNGVSGVLCATGTKLTGITGQPFTKAIRMNTHKTAERASHVQLRIPSIAPIEVGEVCLLSFYARQISATNDTGNAEIDVSFGIAGGDGHGGLSIYLTDEWTKYYLPFEGKYNHATGVSKVVINFGYPPQVIEFSDIEVVSFKGTNTTKADLPSIKYTYRGRDENAIWRQKALENIEKIRKGDMNISVKDENGDPIPDADINIDMKKHTFGFGTATAHYRVLYSNQNQQPQYDDSVNYRNIVETLFNKAVPESALKASEWEKWQDGVLDEITTKNNRTKAIREVNWLQARDIDVRGHTLIWERADVMTKAMNDAIKAADTAKANKDDVAFETAAETLRTAAKSHIDDIMTTFNGTTTYNGVTAGKITEWDLVNEPINNKLIRNILGPESIAEWYTYARANYPENKLYINENGLEHSNASSKFGRFYDLVKQMTTEWGAPVDGIGIQNHIGGQPRSPITAMKNYEKLATLVPNLQITEFDSSFADQDLGADQTRDFLIAAFSIEAFEGFLMWGFWDGQHYAKNASLFSTDWTPKKSLAVYNQLVFNDWMTDETGETDSDGNYSLRGFYGEYEITVTVNGVTQTFDYIHAKDKIESIELVVN